MMRSVNAVGAEFYCPFLSGESPQIAPHMLAVPTKPTAGSVHLLKRGAVLLEDCYA